MTWVKLDDGFFRNSKARAAGKEGRELYLAGLCYCAGSLTDGFIPNRDVALIAAEAEVKPAVVAKLVDAGLWRETTGGWEVPDFLTYNPSADKVKRDREEGKRRAERSRERNAKPQPNEQRTFANGSRDPSRPVPLVSQSSGSNQSVGPPATTTTTTEILEQTWAILAERDRAKYVADLGKQPRSPAAWLVAVAKRRCDDHESDARRILEREPNITPAQLADSLDNVGPGAPGRPVPKAFDAAEKCANPDCAGGFVLDDSGDAVPCPKCRRAS